MGADHCDPMDLAKNGTPTSFLCVTEEPINKNVQVTCYHFGGMLVISFTVHLESTSRLFSCSK